MKGFLLLFASLFIFSNKTKASDILLDESLQQKNGEFQQTENTSQKENNSVNEKSKSEKKWTQNVPIWFFPFEPNRWFLSFNTNYDQTENTDYDQLLMLSSMRSRMYSYSSNSVRETTKKLSLISQRLELGYSFAVPFFLKIALEQKISGESKTTTQDVGSSSQFGSHAIYDTKYKFNDLANPTLSMGGLLRWGNLAIGSSIDHTISQNPHKIFLKTDLNNSEIESANNELGGTSTTTNVFSSYDFSGVLIDLGLESTQFADTRIIKTQGSGVTGYKSITDYHILPRKEVQYKVGIEFKSFENLGIHLVQSKTDPYLIKENYYRYTEDEKKPYTSNGIVLSAKFSNLFGDSFRPSIYYFKLKSEPWMALDGRYNPESTNRGINLAFDFHF